jgi:ketopantoate reductase
MQTIHKLEKTPKEATSSMHRDVLAGRKFELASLTEFVVNEGLKYEMELPTYKMVLDKLHRFPRANYVAAKKAAAQRVYPNKEPLFSQAVLFI